MNEIINILGHSISLEPVMVHEQDVFFLSDKAFFLYSAIPNQWNENDWDPTVQFQSILLDFLSLTGRCLFLTFNEYIF